MSLQIFSGRRVRSREERCQYREACLSFEDFAGFDAAPDVVVDDRFDYGETRFQARGRIDGKGVCIVFTETATGIRLISFRRAQGEGDASL